MQSGLHNCLDLFSMQGTGTQAMGCIFRQSLRSSVLKQFALLHNGRTTYLIPFTNWAIKTLNPAPAALKASPKAAVVLPFPLPV